MTEPSTEPVGPAVRDGSHARRRYLRIGPTGFLHPIFNYKVVVNGETMFATRNTRDAKGRYFKWLNIAPHWRIELHRDGAIINHRPSTKTHVSSI